jgi:hypothetical protein
MKTKLLSLLLCLLLPACSFVILQKDNQAIIPAPIGTPATFVGPAQPECTVNRPSPEPAPLAPLAEFKAIPRNEKDRQIDLLLRHIAQVKAAYNAQQQTFFDYLGQVDRCRK